MSLLERAIQRLILDHKVWSTEEINALRLHGYREEDVVHVVGIIDFIKNWLARKIVYMAGPTVNWSLEELASIPIKTHLLTGIPGLSSKELLHEYTRNRPYFKHLWILILVMVPFKDLPKHTNSGNAIIRALVAHRLKVGK